MPTGEELRLQRPAIRAAFEIDTDAERQRRARAPSGRSLHKLMRRRSTIAFLMTLALLTLMIALVAYPAGFAIWLSMLGYSRISWRNLSDVDRSASARTMHFQPSRSRDHQVLSNHQELARRLQTHASSVLHYESGKEQGGDRYEERNQTYIGCARA